MYKLQDLHSPSIFCDVLIQLDCALIFFRMEGVQYSLIVSSCSCTVCGSILRGGIMTGEIFSCTVCEDER